MTVVLVAILIRTDLLTHRSRPSSGLLRGEGTKGPDFPVETPLTVLLSSADSTKCAACGGAGGASIVALGDVCLMAALGSESRHCLRTLDAETAGRDWQNAILRQVPAEKMQKRCRTLLSLGRPRKICGRPREHGCLSCIGSHR